MCLGRGLAQQRPTAHLRLDDAPIYISAGGRGTHLPQASLVDLAARRARGGGPPERYRAMLMLCRWEMSDAEPEETSASAGSCLKRAARPTVPVSSMTVLTLMPQARGTPLTAKPSGECVTRGRRHGNENTTSRQMLVGNPASKTSPPARSPTCHATHTVRPPIRTDRRTGTRRHTNCTPTCTIMHTTSRSPRRITGTFPRTCGMPRRTLPMASRIGPRCPRMWCASWPRACSAPRNTRPWAGCLKINTRPNASMRCSATPRPSSPCWPRCCSAATARRGTANRTSNLRLPRCTLRLRGADVTRGGRDARGSRLWMHVTASWGGLRCPPHGAHWPKNPWPGPVAPHNDCRVTSRA